MFYLLRHLSSRLFRKPIVESETSVDTEDKDKMIILQQKMQYYSMVENRFS